MNSQQAAINSQRRPVWGTKLVINREIAYGVAVVSAVAAISLALTLQGWRSRIPAFDLIPYIHGVHGFLETGAVPQHGDTGSYGSYKPAGTAWLMLPGVLLFSDPRLYEYAGTALLHILTLAGIYLLARHYFGPWAAVLAVMLYGFSAHSLFLAGSLWPNGRPDFYIWIVYFTHRWVAYRDARYAGAALAVWGSGMYVDMAILPLLFIFPAIWLVYRPPLRLAPLLVAGGFVLALWSPYLRFEAPRGFIDIRSQLLQQNIFPADYRQAWCDDQLTLVTWQEESAFKAEINQAPSPAASTTSFFRVANLVNAMRDKLLYNYQPVVPLPGAGLALLLVTFGGLLIISVPGAHAGKAGPAASWWRLAATGAILLGVMTGGMFVATRIIGAGSILQGAKFLLISRLQMMLIAGGVTLLAGLGMATAVNRILIRVHIKIQTAEQARQARLLVLALLLPWFLLLLFAEAGKPERFMWLWPMQSIFIAAFFVAVLPRLRAPRAVIWAGALLAALAIAANATLTWKVESWAGSGWAGEDAAEIQLVDAVARRIKADGSEQAAIGYHTFIYPFMADYNVTNPLYKAGSEFDLLFLFRHGIENRNRCAEGIAAEDEYRIVETRPKPPEWSPKDYFLVSLDERFDLVDQFGTYQVYRRK